MPLSPAAIGLVFNNQSEILLVKRQDVPYWVLPGGGIDLGEEADKAVIREVHEETGLDVHPNFLCAHYLPINRLAAPTYLFNCSIKSGDLTPSKETKEVAFFPLSHLPKQFFFIHRHWLLECLKEKQCVVRSLNEVTYLALFLYLLKHPMIVLRFAYTRLFKA